MIFELFIANVHDSLGRVPDVSGTLDECFAFIKKLSERQMKNQIMKYEIIKCN